MAYSLSFGPEFFMSDGEPYDGASEPNSEGNPTTVCAAIVAMSDDAWNEMCADVFPSADPEHITPDMVLEQIQQVDTCSNLSSPVEVWIDADGYHTVKVYERDQ